MKREIWWRWLQRTSMGTHLFWSTRRPPVMFMIMKLEKSGKTKMDLRTGHRKICIQKMKPWMTIQEIEGKYEVISI